MKNGLESTGYIKSSNYNRFNSIYLSNIPEYINGDKFSKIVDTQLMPLLQDDGMIVYCCQSTAMKSLNMSETELNELKNKARLISSRDVNIFSIYQLINSVEGLNDIRKNYNVDFFETSALSSFNGLENKDTYVYVKKRK